MFGEKKKRNFFGKLADKLDALFTGESEITDEVLDEMEETLVMSDIGMETCMQIMDEFRDVLKAKYIKSLEMAKPELRNIMIGLVDKGERLKLSGETPLVVMMIGINGGGKTTTIAKLANMELKKGKSVQLAAADTFRAAATEQLQIWGERVGVNVIAHAEGADPAAVLFDACQSARSRGTDVLICDTAGRLQNKKNLMKELEKMNKVIDREFPEADRETLLVLDATTGKNAISQAQEFNEVAALTGVVLTKLDGTAKGGIAITVSNEFDLPIKYVGVGEGIEDLKEFNPEDFIGGIFDE